MHILLIIIINTMSYNIEETFPKAQKIWHVACCIVSTATDKLSRMLTVHMKNLFTYNKVNEGSAYEATN